MFTEKEIFIEKFTNPLPRSFLTINNHTVYNYVCRCENWLDVEEIMKKEGWYFLGITTPPYNPYGKHFNFAFVIEDKENDYEIYWHHISDKWLNKIAENLGINYRFAVK